MNYPLSIIIPTFNRAELLSNTLVELEKLGYFDKYEVIVVDNDDDPARRRESITSCIGHFPKVVVIESEPPGAALARNVGTSAANAELIAFLDDDAIPREGWAEELIAAFRADDVAFACGPIEPLWEQPPPAWIPPEIYAVFTVLDLGGRDRILADSEFGYTANLAVRKSALAAVGGFDESLGRKKYNLLSDEDIEVQRRLRTVGRGAYRSTAKVQHLIPTSRANWHWLVKRFAWQGYSEVMQTGQLEPFHVAALRRTNANASLRALYDAFTLTPSSPEEALDRLEFLRAMIGGIFHAEQGDVAAQGGAPVSTAESEPSFFPSADEPKVDDRRLRRGRNAPTFIEFGTGHANLMDAYGDIPSSGLIRFREDGWRDPNGATRALRQLRATLNSPDWRPVFLTTDWMLFAPSALQEIGRIGGIGILHRTFADQRQTIALKQLAELVQIACYSPSTLAWVESVSATKCILLRHPPLAFKNVSLSRALEIRKRKLAGRQAGQVRVSLVGEVRAGKGFELAIDEIASSGILRSAIHLTLAGGVSSSEKAGKLRAEAHKAGLSCDLHFLPRTAYDHRGISDCEFVNIIRDTDIMLFPYHGRESDAMSGHIVDSVFAGCRILVATESAMSPLVKEWKLGALFSATNPGSLAQTLLSELDAPGPSEDDDAALLDFTTQFSVKAVNEQMRSIMRYEASGP